MRRVPTAWLRTFLGEWLTPERRSELTVGSKWGYTYVADWRHDADTHEVKDHSLDTFERQWPETLQALGGPPDFYLVHSLTTDSPALERQGAARPPREARGLPVYGSGLSTSGPRQAETLRAGSRARRAVQRRSRRRGTCSRPSVGPALAEAHDAGLVRGREGSGRERSPDLEGGGDRRSTSSLRSTASRRTPRRSARPRRSLGPTSC